MMAFITDLNDGVVGIEILQNDDVGMDKKFATLPGSNYWSLVGNISDSSSPKTVLPVLYFKENHIKGPKGRSKNLNRQT